MTKNQMDKLGFLSGKFWIFRLYLEAKLDRQEEIWRRRLAQKLGLPLRYGNELKRSAHSGVGAPKQFSKPIPKKIWCYWAQGFENAPPLVLGCVQSWKDKHPDWDVTLVSDATLAEHLELPDIFHERASSMTYQARADVIRLGLLARHGGVWVDATSFCSVPLSKWLCSLLQAECFVFSNCGYKRPAANWFIAAQPQSEMIVTWFNQAITYWGLTKKAHRYFWPHHIFKTLLRSDKKFRTLYQIMPKVDASASHAVQRYCEDPTPQFFDELKASVDAGCIPVSKLNNWEPGSKEEMLARQILDF